MGRSDYKRGKWEVLDDKGVVEEVKGLGEEGGLTIYNN